MKSSRIRGAAAAVLALGLAVAALAASSWGGTGLARAEALCRGFVEKKMMTSEGGVYTRSKVRNYFFFKKYSLRELRQSGLLSESAGLLMKYAVTVGDKELFEAQLSFVKKYFIGRLGLFVWKISHDGELTADSTASIDDLRIVGACLDAHKRWGEDEHLDFALQVAENIRLHESDGSHLRDFVNWRDWGENTLARTVQLSYLDLPTMRDIEGHKPSWSGFLGANLKMLRGGQFSTGLFYEGFDFETGQYFGKRQNTINQLYCGLFLAEFDGSRHRLLSFFKDKMAHDGVIYAEYDAETGEPTKFFESTSVYALLARYALACGDEIFAARIVERMMRFQNRKFLSPLYGSFSDDEIYSFDNLEALLTLGTFPAVTKDGNGKSGL